MLYGLINHVFINGNVHEFTCFISVNVFIHGSAHEFTCLLVLMMPVSM